MQITVKLFSGQDLSFIVNHTPFVIGRSPKCDVVVPHDGVSRHHCQIEVEESEVWVTDLGSTNGVMIDGIKIEPNKRTKWMTYLTLSFGPVQSVQVSFDDTHSGMKATPRPAQPVTVTTQNLTKTQSFRGPEQAQSQILKLELEQKSQGKPKLKKQITPSRDDEEKKKKLLIGGVLLLVALGLAYYFTMGSSDTENVEIVEPVQ